MEKDHKPGHEHEKIFFVNKRELRTKEERLQGSQILQLAGLDVNQYDLFLVHGQKSEKILPDQSVIIENGMHFNAIVKSVPYG